MGQRPETERKVSDHFPKCQTRDKETFAIWGIDFPEVFSHVPWYGTIRIILAVDVRYNLRGEVINLKNCFINFKVREERYVRHPKGFEARNAEASAHQMKKAGYGLFQASEEFYEHIDRFLLELEYIKCKSDPSFYVPYKSERFVFFLLYVDDVCLSGIARVISNISIDSFKSKYHILVS